MTKIIDLFKNNKKKNQANIQLYEEITDKIHLIMKTYDEIEVEVLLNVAAWLLTTTFALAKQKDLENVRELMDLVKSNVLNVLVKQGYI